MQIIAHRGASGYKPENTLAAFRHALDMGVDMIELDVYRLKSGELVVMHDKTVDRTTDGNGKIEHHSLEELRGLDAGQREPVPLLHDVIDLVDKRVPINIELKGRGTAKAVAALLRGYIEDEGWSADHFIVSSFNHGLVRQFMRELPQVRTSALVYRAPFWLRPLCFRKDIHSINFSAQYVREQDIATAHRLGKKVFVYDVDTEALAQYMHELRVDAIFTNYPDITSRISST